MKIHPSKAEFMKLSRRGNVIPVYGELPGELETPVSAFLKLDDSHFSYLLESVEGAEKVARYSFVGSNPRMVIAATGRHIEISELRKKSPPRVRSFETADDPLAELQRIVEGYRFVSNVSLPRFCGGLVGYLGYNTIRFIERLPAHKLNDLRLPDIMFILADAMTIFDHAQHKLLLVANAIIDGCSAQSAYKKALGEIIRMSGCLGGPLPSVRKKYRGGSRRNALRSNISRREFTSMVRKAKEAIRKGEAIQIVLSQRLEQRLYAKPFDVYRVLRSLNPSPYMYFLRFGSVSLAGSSPEMLVRCEDGELETRPIAGTRPRGESPKEDERMARRLLSSSKERAEHLMLVDLGRNDLGRVSRVGTVKTPEFMIVEKYSHVLHLVSSVTGILKPGKSIFDVLRAIFPAGTVTGAPKVRAMELIAELERSDRGPYAGAIGYFSFSGNLDSCITIRTILIKNKRAYVQVGAGIVADSQPGREFQETLSKARAMLSAIEIAEKRATNRRNVE